MIHVPPTRKLNSLNPITSKTSSYYIIRLCLKSRILSLRALNPVQLWWGSSHTTFLSMWRPRTKETNYLPLYTCICSLVYMYTTIYKRQDNHNRQSCSKRRIKMKDIGLLVSGNELRSSHFTLIKSKSWTTWKINTSFGIPKRGGHKANCGSKTKQRQVNTGSYSLPEWRLTNRKHHGNHCQHRETWTVIDKFLEAQGRHLWEWKTPGDPATEGILQY